MSYGISTFRLECPICKEQEKPDPTFASSRKNAKACLNHREEYYRKYHRRRYAGQDSLKVTQSRMVRARKTWHVAEHACAVPGCGYTKLTRRAKVAHGEGIHKEVKEISLCPKHLFELRCGFLEAWTWIEKKVEAPAAPEAPDAPK